MHKDFSSSCYFFCNLRTIPNHFIESSSITILMKPWPRHLMLSWWSCWWVFPYAEDTPASYRFSPKKTIVQGRLVEWWRGWQFALVHSTYYDHSHVFQGTSRECSMPLGCSQLWVIDLGQRVESRVKLDSTLTSLPRCSTTSRAGDNDRYVGMVHCAT